MKTKQYRPKIGDRVRVVKCFWGHGKHHGMTGTITEIDYDGEPLVVCLNGVSCRASIVEPVVKRGRPKGSKAKPTFKVPRCLKTVTGNHKWKVIEDKVWARRLGYEYPKCVYCGLVDDREDNEKV